MNNLKSKVLVASLFICFALLLAGCSELSEGDVYAKEFKPANTTTMIMPMVMSDGKTSTTYYIPFVYSYPDRWVISVQKYSEKRKKFYYADFYVTQEVYDSVNIGDYFVFDGKKGSREEPYTKVRKEDYNGEVNPEDAAPLKETTTIQTAEPDTSEDINTDLKESADLLLKGAIIVGIFIVIGIIVKVVFR